MRNNNNNTAAQAIRPKRRQLKTIEKAASKFFVLLALGVVIAACIHLEVFKTQRTNLQYRALESVEKDEDTCRLVHSAVDQCRFIKKHCPLDEAGFTEYLDLYYCKLSHLKPIAFIILVSWLGLLFSTIGIAASDFFCVDLSTMAKILGMSESMAGVTLLAFGNGSPDVFSTFAAMSTNTGDLAVGELMGAAGFITAVVAGSMAIIRPFKVSKKSFIRDVGFFTVAAAFTMVILSDGILHLWECLAMIGYYVFYVSFVLFWHWIEARRKRTYDTEAAARGHYTPTALDGQDSDQQPYSDEPNAEALRPPTLRAPSTDDFAALERSITEDDGDYSDEERDRWMSELNTNMRLARPITRPRATTIAPVRPSLVGALEFQAVLKSLQRSRNTQAVRLNARRYSDDPNLRAYDIQEHPATHRRASINPASVDQQRPHLHVSIPEIDQANPGRATTSRLLDDDLQRPGRKTAARHVNFAAPTIEVSHSSPPQHPVSSGNASRMLPHSTKSEDLFQHRRLLKNLNSPSLSPQESPHRQHILLPSPPRSRSATRTARSPSSPFPAYQDDPSASLEHLALPPPVVDISPESTSIPQEDDFAIHPTQWHYWPYRYLPTPESLACILFPTIVDWQDKGIWAKSLGIIAAPSVFLLTITLPVVESDLEDSNPAATTPFHAATSNTPSQIAKHTDNFTGFSLEQPHKIDASTSQEQYEPAQQIAVESGDTHLVMLQQSALYEAWPRWLLLIQLYTAPMSIIISVWIQSPETLPLSWLTRPALISLLLSTILLVPVLLTTTSTYRPRQYRWILSLVGFAVSIAWISSIASQVVGTLKALAIILNWSNAIMGLTVFAVGNSVSDLVADVTVANLGYPVMALSACFGGPMLNILLGIGLSGTYTILNGADRRKHKHPDKGFKIKTYHLDVGQTLIISGVALLITLLGVLVLVPLSNWMMTRKIGIALIIIWILSTIGNVVVEVTGIADVSKLQ